MITEQIFNQIFDEAFRQGVTIGAFGTNSENVDQGNKYTSKEDFKNAFLKNNPTA